MPISSALAIESAPALGAPRRREPPELRGPKLYPTGFDLVHVYTTATKVQELGAYVTFRLSFGPQYAGKFVVVTRMKI